MTTPALAQPSSSSRPRISALLPEPPAWARDLFTDGTGTNPAASERHGLLDVLRRDGFVRVTARIPDAASLEGIQLSRLVAERYAAITTVLSDLRKHPIRFWNYVPGIVEPIGDALDRYMAFNRGRHAAYAELWRNTREFARSVPAASAVGITGPDLVIDCLASDCAGTPVDNPRQIAAWRYSRRYGPRPPCFARGSITRLRGRTALLLAGTASIVGEDSQHAGDVRAQVAEVIKNIEALIVNAGGCRRQLLHQLTDARIYVVHADDIEMVETEIRARASTAIRIETAVARVCRPELLVEVEGVAELR